MLLPSSFKVKSDGRRAQNTSLDRLRIYSSPVTDEDHVCQTCEGRGPGGQNRDTHLTFSGPRLQRAIGATSRLSSLAPLCCTRQSYKFSCKSGLFMPSDPPHCTKQKYYTQYRQKVAYTQFQDTGLSRFPEKVQWETSSAEPLAPFQSITPLTARQYSHWTDL